MEDFSEEITRFGKVINVAVVDDHQLFRAGIISLLEHYEEIEVTLQAANGREFLKQLEGLKIKNKPGKKSKMPDVVLLDLQMPEMNGIQTTLHLQEDYPDIRIIILTMHNEDEFIFDLMNKGASGFLAKDKTVETVFEALNSVVKDGVYINEQVLKAIVRGANRKVMSGELLKPELQLTEREKEIIHLICDQKTNKEIADILHLSPRTIESQRTTILAKTEMKNTAGLVLYAIKNNLIKVTN